MKNFYLKVYEYRIGYCVFFLALFLGPFFQTKAQRNNLPRKQNDYIVIADTMKSDGYIQTIPDQLNTHLFFKVLRKDTFVKYSIKEVSEFRVDEKVYQRKEIPMEGKKETVFLQVVDQKYSNVTLYKLKGKKDLFFLDDKDGLRLITANYREQLASFFDYPILEPLIDITKYEEYSLVYLFNTAKSITKPRTFTRVISITPYVGYALTENTFTSALLNLKEKVKGKATVFGMNLEINLNEKRSLSWLFSPNWSNVIAQELTLTSKNNFDYETDYFLDYSMIQIPTLLRYYFDLKPNSLRPYIEMGYSFSFIEYKNLGVFQAKISGNTVNTSREEIELKSKYNGMIGGFGIEKYLKKSKAISVGVRTCFLKEQQGEKFTSNSIFLGFKF